MTTVAIVYFSGTGHTQAMAESLAEGVQSVEGTLAKVFSITGEQIIEGRWQDDAMLAEIGTADAIVFGSPTFMGGVAAQMKAFVDAASAIWFVQGWKNKLAGGFTHSGSPSGDKQGTLLYLAINAAQHGMIWVSTGELPNSDNGVNRLGSNLGVMGSGQAETVEPSDLKTAQLYGQRMAKATHAWSAGQLSS